VLAENLLMRLQPTGLLERITQPAAETTLPSAYARAAAPRPPRPPGYPAPVERSDGPARTQQPLPGQAIPAAQIADEKTGGVRPASPHRLLRNVTVHGAGAPSGDELALPPSRPATRRDSLSPMGFGSSTQGSAHAADHGSHDRTSLGPAQPGANQGGTPINPAGSLPASPAILARTQHTPAPFRSQAQPGRQTAAWPNPVSVSRQDTSSFDDAQEPSCLAEGGLPAIAPAYQRAGHVVGAAVDQPIDLAEIVDEVAARLHLEADLRGIDR
jgi:hypothetical protein